MRSPMGDRDLRDLSGLVDDIVAEATLYGPIMMGGIRRYADRHGMNVDGDIWVGDDSNTFTVVGASEEFCHLARAVIASRRLQPAVASWLYDRDPAYGLPLADGNTPAGGYKDPHWLPLEFTPRR